MKRRWTYALSPDTTALPSASTPDVDWPRSVSWSKRSRKTSPTESDASPLSTSSASKATSIGWPGCGSVSSAGQDVCSARPKRTQVCVPLAVRPRVKRVGSVPIWKSGSRSLPQRTTSPSKSTCVEPVRSRPVVITKVESSVQPPVVAASTASPSLEKTSAGSKEKSCEMHMSGIAASYALQ